MLPVLSFSILMLAFGICGLMAGGHRSRRQLSIYFLFAGPALLLTSFAKSGSESFSGPFLFALTLMVVATLYIVVARRILPAYRSEKGGS